MKYLMYSKKFKQNLVKWLCMYCGIVCLFTIIVTYSRYITELTSQEGARVAKFNVYVTYNGVCSQIDSNEDCNYGSLRPIDSLSYYFTVDTRQLEVNTTLVTNILINEDFENYRLYDVTSVEKLYVENIDYSVTNNTISIVEDVNALNGYLRKYKLTVDYKNKDNYNQNYYYNDDVIFGYSAIQK